MLEALTGLEKAEVFCKSLDKWVWNAGKQTKLEIYIWISLAFWKLLKPWVRMSSSSLSAKVRREVVQIRNPGSAKIGGAGKEQSLGGKLEMQLKKCTLYEEYSLD